MAILHQTMGGDTILIVAVQSRRPQRSLSSAKPPTTWKVDNRLSISEASWGEMDRVNRNPVWTKTAELVRCFLQLSASVLLTLPFRLHRSGLPRGTGNYMCHEPVSRNPLSQSGKGDTRLLFVGFFFMCVCAFQHHSQNYKFVFKVVVEAQASIYETDFSYRKALCKMQCVNQILLNPSDD